MTTLYLAWQDPQSRGWFPVGRLTSDESDPATYEFAYLDGAKRAKELANFWGVPGFPDLNRLYADSQIFPAFRSRVMDPSRPDRPEYLLCLGLNINDWDEVAELSVSGGLRNSDNFEVFPEIVPDRDGRFDTRFVLHGLRHTNLDSIRRSELVEAGEQLQLSFELNNPMSTHAISVKTDDHYILGWLPRYLTSGLYGDKAWMVSEVRATVAHVNLELPLSHRLLVSLNGRLPEGFRPMRDLPQYKPILPGSPQADVGVATSAEEVKYR